MNLKLRLITVGLLTLFAFGCGGGEIRVDGDGSPAEGTPDEGDDGPPGSVEGQPMPQFHDVGNELARARCELILDCCTEEEQASNFGHTTDDMSDCLRQEMGAFGGLGGYGLEVSWDRGRIKFHEGRAELCSHSLSELTCSSFDGSYEQGDSLPGCKDMIEGLVANGDECDGDFECQSGYCHHVFPDEGGDGVGSCQNEPGLDDDCPDLRCDESSYCDRFDEVCLEKKMTGEACMRDDECLTNRCRGDEDGNMRCEERPVVCSG